MMERRIAVANGSEPADCVIKNGKIVDVFNGEIISGDIAIADGYIAGIGYYEGKKVIDAQGKFVAPSFIDGHVHIESSMLTPAELAKVLLPHGVTAIVADPHEIANVVGAAGIQYMLDSTENLLIDFYFMLPSCVPATPYENAGAVLEMEDLEPFLTHPRVLGLAEVMNAPAVMNCEPSMMKKISETQMAGKKVDGHAAGLKSHELNAYMSAGIRTDHEATTLEEAKERIQKGMYLMVREGTVARDLKNIIGAVTESNSRRCVFVTDDKHLDDLLHEGSIDFNVRLAIAQGIAPITAIQMASINTAECFGLANLGAVAPGYIADFLFLDDLDSVNITQVFKNGKLVADKGKLADIAASSQDKPALQFSGTVHIQEISKQQLKIKLDSNLANIIQVIPNSLLTKHVIEETTQDAEGYFQTCISKDHLKLAVVERHRMTGNIGLGIVKGFGLKSGAIASTIAHDSHNVIIAGTNDDDMITAAMAINELQGGIVVIQNGQVISSLKLPIAGIMSDLSYKEVYKQLNLLTSSLEVIGANTSFNPFLTLSFLALPVIPELKLTDLGLFDVTRFTHISIAQSH
ncbi:adenine deaminase [Bacillus sp. M6-12]|uniref:adenine deaminase n=1 Tax=Bacillus sp. M6-12 TaxID=2054166 RepID=UPI000C7854CF|nr:adenine deaminase [Bacillus sp. M6-12]PLS17434.1 adenine deaminase [Bacillus sp. M6-12]